MNPQFSLTSYKIMIGDADVEGDAQAAAAFFSNSGTLGMRHFGNIQGLRVGRRKDFTVTNSSVDRKLPQFHKARRTEACFQHSASRESLRQETSK